MTEFLSSPIAYCIDQEMPTLLQWWASRTADDQERYEAYGCHCRECWIAEERMDVALDRIRRWLHERVVKRLNR